MSGGAILDDIRYYDVLVDEQKASTHVSAYRSGYIDARTDSTLITEQTCYTESNLPACETDFEYRPVHSSCTANHAQSAATSCTERAGYTTRQCFGSKNWVRLCRRKFPSGYALIKNLKIDTLLFEETLCLKCCLVTSATTRNNNGCPISYVPIDTTKSPRLVDNCYENNLAMCRLVGADSVYCYLDRLNTDDRHDILTTHCITEGDGTRSLSTTCLDYYSSNSSNADVARYRRTILYVAAFIPNRTTTYCTRTCFGTTR